MGAAERRGGELPGPVPGPDVAGLQAGLLTLRRPAARHAVRQRHSDSRTILRYHMSRAILDRHADHPVAAYLAGIEDGPQVAGVIITV